jgi:hypothetical protein
MHLVALVAALAVAALAVVLVALLASGARVPAQSRGGPSDGDDLRDRFGPEYDHAVRLWGRAEAEHWMRGLVTQRGGLDVRALPAASRDRAVRDWDRVQSLFVESPAEAVDEADELLTSVMEACGYPLPTDGTGVPRAGWLAVDHPRVAWHLRAADDIREVGADGCAPGTEALREALGHYRVLVETLIGAPLGAAERGRLPSSPGALPDTP